MLWLLSWMNCIMPEFPRSDFRLHVGWRNIKTSVTAMLVAMAYCLIGRNPAFTDKSIRKILYETRNFFRAKTAPKRFRVFGFFAIFLRRLLSHFFNSLILPASGSFQSGQFMLQ